MVSDDDGENGDDGDDDGEDGEEPERLLEPRGGAGMAAIRIISEIRACINGCCARTASVTSSIWKSCGGQGDGVGEFETESAKHSPPHPTCRKTDSNTHTHANETAKTTRGQAYLLRRDFLVELLAAAAVDRHHEAPADVQVATFLWPAVKECACACVVWESDRERECLRVGVCLKEGTFCLCACVCSYSSFHIYVSVGDNSLFGSI